MLRLSPSLIKLLFSCVALLLAIAVQVTMPALALAQAGGFNNPPGGNQPPPEAIIFILVVYAIVIIGIIAFSLAITIFICYLLSTLIKAVPPQFQLIQPGSVWLLLIPCFSIIWIFFVFTPIARSYQNYFRSIGRHDVGDCGEALGLWYCICVVACAIPFVSTIAGPASLILLILYFVKLFGLKSQIGAVAQQPKWGV